MTHPARHRDHDLARKRAVRLASVTAIVVTFAMVLGGVFVYRHLNGNINEIDTAGLLGDRPDKVENNSEPLDPLNILLLGSDTREGQSGHIGGDTPGLSDTTILLHLSADRKRAYGVSLPRDAMVERPDCEKEDGSVVPGGLAMFNTAYALGGPACTQKTVEQLTGIRVDHFVVVEFDGFRHMVNALGGIPICVPQEVNDTIGNIHLPAGSYEATGDQALDYVRLRHGLSENGDIGRMKRQQVFLASMANKAISAGTLANPVKLYKFLDAATKSLTTDPGLSNIKDLGTLANQLRHIGLKNIQFITVPWETYQPDHNRLIWAPEATRLWHRLENDQELTPGLSKHVTTAADSPTDKPGHGSGGTKSPSPSGTPTSQPSPTPSDEAKAAEAREFGLCA
ncbi:MAG TPA: LCP family protein [Nocardioidaceae bacterium]|nr:LCP family protein [Nocardioidaceae bacterium]